VREQCIQLMPASLLLRAVGFLIDWAVVLVVSMFLATGLGLEDNGRLLVLLVTASVYEIVCLVALSTTPGKMAMRMQVVDESDERLQPDTAILRYLVFFVTSPLFIVSYLLAASDPQRRAIHDRVAKTRVVKAPTSPEGRR
jgi:uncharacterized RDD family membrane protein YckC